MYIHSICIYIYIYTYIYIYIYIYIHTHAPAPPRALPPREAPVSRPGLVLNVC